MQIRGSCNWRSSLQGWFLARGLSPPPYCDSTTLASRPLSNTVTMDAAWARSLRLEDVSIVLHRVWQVIWFARNVTGPDKVRTKVPCKRVGATVSHRRTSSMCTSNRRKKICQTLNPALSQQDRVQLTHSVGSAVPKQLFSTTFSCHNTSSV